MKKKFRYLTVHKPKNCTLAKLNCFIFKKLGFNRLDFFNFFTSSDNCHVGIVSHGTEFSTKLQNKHLFIWQFLHTSHGFLVSQSFESWKYITCCVVRSISILAVLWGVSQYWMCCEGYFSTKFSIRGEEYLNTGCVERSIASLDVLWRVF